MKKLIGIAIAAVAVFTGLSGLGEANGNIWEVTKVEDTADGKCDDDCSLREAIIAANESPGYDIIRVPYTGWQTPYVLSRTLGEAGQKDPERGALYISSDVTIWADHNARIDAHGLGDRAMYVDDARVRIYNLRIEGGTSEWGYQTTPGGGAIMNHGGILALSGVRLYENSAVFGSGAIESIGNGSLRIYNARITHNRVETGVGAIYADTPLTIKHTTLYRNSSDDGDGALRVQGEGKLIIENSTFARNYGANFGCPAIYANTSGETEIENVRFSQNRANGNYDYFEHCIDSEKQASR